MLRAKNCPCEGVCCPSNTAGYANLGQGHFSERFHSQALTPEQHLVYTASTGALFYDADGNGAGAAVQIALMGTDLPIASADINLIA